MEKKVNPIDYWYKKYLKEKEKKCSIKPPVPEPLKLTVKDITRIFRIHDVLQNEQFEAQNEGTMKYVTAGEYYKEIEKRFNNGECA